MQQEYSKFIQMGLTAAAVLGFAAWQLWATKRHRRAQGMRDAEDTREG